jgi:phosphohistidine phosphatase SixA
MTAPPLPLRSRLLLRRRTLVALPLAAIAGSALGQEEAALEALRSGGVVIAFRHSLAPGTFDPPGFRLGDCSTQRNLSEEGRAQARAIGAWMKRHRLEPRNVRASPWCRCLDTARLAFGHADPWPALGAPRGTVEATSAEHLQQLRAALVAAGRERGFTVWVTHMFVLNALAGTGTASGEGLVLRGSSDSRAEVVARLQIA